MGNSTAIGMCVQVAFILAGNTFAGYNKLLKNAPHIEAVDSNAYMDIMRAFDARNETWLLRLTASEIAALQDGRILPPLVFAVG